MLQIYIFFILQIGYLPCRGDCKMAERYIGRPGKPGKDLRQLKLFQEKNADFVGRKYYETL